jgi:hypothetical protein
MELPMSRRWPFVYPVLLAGLAAQSHLSPPHTIALQDRFAVVQREASGLWGFGAHYRTRFGEDQVEFVACGAVEGPALQVSLHAQAVGRGLARQPLPMAEPQERDLTVRYDRGSVVEVYDVRPRAMEQSFVFRELPAGEGDLVVDVQLDTALPVLASTPDRLEFGAAEGGVVIAGVVGIDARGVRAPGSLSFADGVLSLRLPAAFVQTAALPLILDPLMTPVTRNAVAIGADGWDAAHDLSSNTTLFAWFELVSANTYTLKGWFEPGGPVAIRASALLGSNASVANVAGLDAFVVAWEEEANVTSGLRSRILGRALFSPSNRGPETTIQIDQNRDLQRPRLGSNTLPAGTPGYDSVLLSYHARTGTLGASGELGDALIRVVGVSPPGGLFAAQPVVVSNNATAIGLSRSNITGGNYLVTWGEASAAGLASLSARVFNVGAGAVTPEAVHALPTNTQNPGYYNLHDLVADGDATGWSVLLTGHRVANIVNEYSTTPWLARCELLTPSDVRITELVDARNPASNTGRWPSIGTTPSSAVCVRNTVYQNPCIGGGGVCNQGEVRTHARVRCQNCESLEVVGSGAVVVRPGAFGVVPAARNEEIQLFGTERDTVSGTNYLKIWNYRVDDGTVVGLGGGCGSLTTTARVECATVGGSRCDLLLEGLPPTPNTWLVIGVDRLDAVGCGTCTLVPNPFTAILADGGDADDFGRVSVGFVLPNAPALRGLAFLTQWLIQSGPASCPTFPLAMSNALQVTIQ